MSRKSKRPPGAANRGGRGVSQHRREHARTLSRRNAAVDFGAINEAALGCLAAWLLGCLAAWLLGCLPALCARWLPDGRRVGHEWEARNPRRVDRRPGSFKVNLKTGRWADFALSDIKGGDPVSLAAYLSGRSQTDAARALADMLGVET